METVEDLLAQQVQLISSLQRALINFKKMGKAKMTEPVIRHRLSTLKESFAKAQELDGKIIARANDPIKEAHPYFKTNQLSIAEDAFNDAADFMAETLASVTGESTAAAHPAGDRHPQLVSHLPQLHLPTFDGTLSQWEQFRDKFKSIVCKDKTISDVDRLHYLLTSLKGEASDALNRLDITEKNFAVAWEMLVSRYEHKSRLVAAHLQSLYDLPLLQTETSRDLQSLRDTANMAIKSLKLLGRPVDYWDDIFVFFVTIKLTPSLRKAWRLARGESRECPSYEALNSFLAQQVLALEESVTAPPAVNKNSSRPSVKSQQPKQLVSHAVTSNNLVCPACRSNHLLYQCDKFRNQSPSDRYTLIKNTKRCLNCFSANHTVKDCKSTRTCKQCRRRHHTMLHFSASDAPAPNASVQSSKPESQGETSANASLEAPCLTSALAPTVKVLLATAYVKVYSPSGNCARARALLDQGSATSIISENLVQILRLHKKRRSICIQGIGQTQTPARYAVDVMITPQSKRAPVFSTTAIVLTSLTRYLPTKIRATCTWSHVSNLELADPDPMSSQPIDLLIGADLYGSIILDGVRKGASNEPVAQNTAFGWILSGPIENSIHTQISTITLHHGTLQETFESELRRFWEIEEIPRESFPSPEDISCEEHFLANHARTSEGRYVVRLPFKKDMDAKLGCSKQSALSRFLSLERRLQQNPMDAAEYSRFLQEYESLGHMERIAKDINNPRTHYYIPHHGVFRPESTTSRIRVVFNASCQTSTGISLNDLFLVGPKLQTDLSAVILLWRQSRFVYTADIEKMYRQVLVDSRDRDYQRILWRANPSHPIAEYRLNTVTYGTASAPYQAQRVLRQLIVDEGASFPLAVPVLQHQIYVDDCIFGADDVPLALQTRNQLISLLKKGGFRLRKWASNCPTLLSDLNPEDHGLACSKELRGDEYLKILGITWCPESDTFRFQISVPSTTSATKRTLLSVIAKLYDPLGWVSPVVVVAKILIQHLWKLKCDWDDPLPEHLLNKWERHCSLLHHLKDVQIPRWTGQTSDTVHMQLHGFADASTVAYAAVVYLRVTSVDGSITISLLTAKSKVAPVKTLSIPRLELTAAHLLARLIDFVRSSLMLQQLPCICWTDSTITRAWLSRSPSTWKTYVANRVAEIQSLLLKVPWRHVPSEDNPADCASRGLSASELVSHSLWWEGPTWLKLPPDSWPNDNEPIVEGDSEEARSVFHTHSTVTIEPWDLQSRYSSWLKLLRVTAFVLRFVHSLRHAPRPPRKGQPKSMLAVHPEEIRAAKCYWYKVIQTACFPEDLTTIRFKRPLSKSSPLRALNPYLDTHELLRVGSRLQHSNLPEASKNPIILSSHPLVATIIRYHHEKTLHGGPSMTLASVRGELWILRARTMVRSIIHKCIPCVREAAKVPTELMGAIPSMRVTQQTRAFIHTGVDYAGPIMVKMSAGRGHHARKAYIALFICMTVKAIHIELVSDYSSQAFIGAFHRFVARRGLPSNMYSDNGTTFQGADRELQQAHRSTIQDPNFLNEIAMKGTVWHFLPPASPHFGGLWEAAVRSVKHHLKRCIGAHTLTFEEMTTFLCRVESCLNSRPLGAVSDAADEYATLTPGHFLIGASMIAPPEPSVLNLQENRLSRWQLVQRLSEVFWKSWSRDYLHTLHQRPKWRVTQRLARVGQLVLLRDPNTPPSHWSLGRIVECHPGPDGLTRVVTIKTPQSKLKRPLAKLCFLPIDITNETDALMAGGASTSVATHLASTVAP